MTKTLQKHSQVCWHRTPHELNYHSAVASLSELTTNSLCEFLILGVKVSSIASNDDEGAIPFDVDDGDDGFDVDDAEGAIPSDVDDDNEGAIPLDVDDEETAHNIPLDVVDDEETSHMKKKKRARLSE